MIKKKVFLIFAVVSVLCLCITFSGCGDKKGNTNNNHEVPPSSQAILATRIISFGSYISWAPVSGATTYEIYKDNCLIKTQTSTIYDVGNLDKDSEFYTGVYFLSFKR